MLDIELVRLEAVDDILEADIRVPDHGSTARHGSLPTA
jgi:hypothetical protein